MAGVATSKISVKVTGLGDTIETNSDWDTSTLTVPVERGANYVIVDSATTTALQLSTLVPHIALAKMDMLYIKAEVGTIYVQFDTAGTTTFDDTAADVILTVGKDMKVHLSQSNNAGVTIDAAAVTDAFSYVLTGT